MYSKYTDKLNMGLFSVGYISALLKNNFNKEQLIDIKEWI
jgi:hypothetical protein